MLGRVQVKRSGNVIGQDVTFKMSDRAGSGKTKFQDSDGANAAYFDSQGNLFLRGQVRRIT